MREAELVFIPAPGMGHLVSAVEMAQLLVNKDQRLSVTVFILKLSFDHSKLDAYMASLATTKSIRFIHLPQVPIDQEIKPFLIYDRLVESQRTNVKEAVTKLIAESGTEFNSTRGLAGFVIDMFCTSMIDVANEFGVPTYLYFTSSVGFLGFMLYLQDLYDKHGEKYVAELSNSDAEFSVPSFVNPVPTRVFPDVVLHEEGVKMFLQHARRFRETRGILVNTFLELEPHAIGSFLDGKLPPVYPVGPILNLKSDASGGSQDTADIIMWLDNQPPSSVVFLCFGSRGSFGEDQVREIARALEQSGVRFLWSLRQSLPKGAFAMPSDYSDLRHVLPEGFLDRTAGIGKVIGWAPQVDILANKAIGGFVSHCGWNSTLESFWFGVPIATWPMYAEQQTNAFELVVELGLAVEIRLDYRRDSATEKASVSAEEIESGIRKLMTEEGETEVLRKKVKDMSEKSRKTVMDGGSSFSSLIRFIDDVLAHMQSN